MGNALDSGDAPVQFFLDELSFLIKWLLLGTGIGIFAVSVWTKIKYGSEFPSYLRDRYWSLWRYIFIVLRIRQDFMFVM